jgi:hypothetical protein
MRVSDGCCLSAGSSLIVNGPATPCRTSEVPKRMAPGAGRQGESLRSHMKLLGGAVRPDMPTWPCCQGGQSAGPLAYHSTEMTPQAYL